LSNIDLNTRIAGPDDALALSEIGTTSFRAAYGDSSPAQDTNAYLEECFSPAAIREELERNGVTYLLVTANEVPAGLVKMHRGNVPDGIPGANTREIHQFYISPSHQRIGIGAKLMDAALRFAAADSVDVVWLTVWEKADWAINFYLKHHFSQAGTIDFTVGSTVYNDYLMWRPVDELENDDGC
jgi:ribosomal protein S18 acetylase RimI-like enzyme